jgi:hypothetical protein
VRLHDTKTETETKVQNLSPILAAAAIHLAFISIILGREGRYHVVHLNLMHVRRDLPA